MTIGKINWPNSLIQAIPVVILLLGYIVYTENRLTALETNVINASRVLEGHLKDPTIHHQKFEKVEEQINIMNQILGEIKQMNKRMDNIEKKL